MTPPLIAKSFDNKSNDLACMYFTHIHSFSTQNCMRVTLRELSCDCAAVKLWSAESVAYGYD